MKPRGRFGARLVAALLGAAAAACPAPNRGAAAREPGSEPAPVEVIAVADLAYCAIEDPRRVVVRDRPSWESLWREIHATSSERPPLPEVDFTRDLLVVVACGMRRSGGFDITIERAVRDRDRLVVWVLETCPPADALTSGALSQPLQVVRMPAAREVVFRERRDPACR